MLLKSLNIKKCLPAHYNRTQSNIQAAKAKEAGRLF
jgi:hypothetical protein